MECYWALLFFITSCLTTTIDSLRYACPCDKSEFCNHVQLPKQKVEAFVVTDGKSDHSKWKWDHITMVLNTGADEDYSLMCHAHSQNKGYGFIVKLPGYAVYNNNSAYTEWVEAVNNRRKGGNAEGVAVDLVDILGKCHPNKDRVEDISSAVYQIYYKLKTSGWPKLICIVPWKPPCFEGECYLPANLTTYCDYFVTSPDSFINSCDLQCKAQATIPKGRLVLGLEEYLAAGVTKDKLMLGIPWHGYDYNCSDVKFTGSGTEICMIPRKNGSADCDFQPSRRRLTLGNIMDRFPKMFRRHDWNGLQGAPYFNYKNLTNNESHQVWFEAYDSLLDKYNIVHATGIEGVVIWTADDLSNHKDSDSSTEGMWYWLVHTIFLTGSTVKDTEMSMAGKAAAIGVGCFLGGCLFGFLVTFIAFHKRVKKLKMRRPFEKDDVIGDEYHDDDENL